jgi:hypothetical protein
VRFISVSGASALPAATSTPRFDTGPATQRDDKESASDRDPASTHTTSQVTCTAGARRLCRGGDWDSLSNAARTAFQRADDEAVLLVRAADAASDALAPEFAGPVAAWLRHCADEHRRQISAVWQFGWDYVGPPQEPLQPIRLALDMARALRPDEADS